MNEYVVKYGEQSGFTSIHPAIVIIIIIACFCMLNVNKVTIASIFLVLGIVIPIDQKIVMFGFGLYSIRIIIIFSWFAVLRKYKLHVVRFTKLDRLFVLWALAKVIIWTILWQDFFATLNIIGWIATAFGVYFLFRVLVLNVEEINTLLKVLSIVSLFIALFMVVEQVSSRNLFSYLGSSPTILEFTQARDGKLRSQGPFQHPICAGMFGATLVPLYIAQVVSWRRSRWHGIIGLFAAVIIVITSSSSGPFLSMVMGIVGLLLWKMRYNMRTLRLFILIVLVSLHLVMKGPVWALIGKVAVVGGSTGYHRVELITSTINNFDEWWLLGVKDTGHWGYGMDDMINYFIVQGIQGGLIGFILFICITIQCYKVVGMGVSKYSKAPHKFFIWGLGAALFSHMVGFFGIAYFDQQVIMMYIVFAFISMLEQGNVDYRHVTNGNTFKKIITIK